MLIILGICMAYTTLIPNFYLNNLHETSYWYVFTMIIRMENVVNFNLDLHF